MSIKVGIFGAGGYTGQELIGLLLQHPAMSITFAVSDSMAGEADHPITYIRQADADLSGVDMVFLCTPHGASAPLADQALKAGAKVVDLSADLRLTSAASFAEWYQYDHPAPHLLPTPYGLPELNRANLTTATCIANPGCYPTSILLALAPLADILQPAAPIIADSKSGVSGAGRAPKPHTHFVEVFGDCKPYSIGREHRHTGEIEQELHALNPQVGPLIFSPHLLPVDRGMVSVVYAPIQDGYSAEAVRGLFEAAYGDEPLVEVLPDAKTARLKDAVRTNKAVLSLTQPTPTMVVVVSAIDNLRKGAASQAIQNANLMFNLPETTGLVETYTWNAQLS